MKKKTIEIILFFLATTTSVKVFSQASSGEINAIQTVVPFLTIAPDSRAGAIGDAGVATSPDCYSMHWNPAKFAFIDGNGGVGISYAPWLRTLVPDINILPVMAELTPNRSSAEAFFIHHLGTFPSPMILGTFNATLNQMNLL
jgi:hypothetical protein